MTDKGTFIVNGAERVIVSQIVRSPGVYFKCDPSPTGKRLYNATMIPNRGAWVKFETDANAIIHVKIDKNRNEILKIGNCKMSLHVLIDHFMCFLSAHTAR